MRANEFLAELGNAPAPHQPHRKRTKSAFWADVDGKELGVFFDRSQLTGTLQITFTVDGSYDATGIEGQRAFKIFSTVLDIIKQRLPAYIKQYSPPKVSFTSKLEDTARANIYERFARVIDSMISSKYEREPNFDTLGQTLFLWKRRTTPAQTTNEAFDQPYPVKWEKGEHGDYDALATLDDGTYLSIMFNNEGDDEYQIEFHRNNSQAVTGEGDAQRIFATVLNAIQQFLKVEQPWRFIFSASKDVEPGQNSQSRAKLYDRLIQRYANVWGYDMYHEDHGDQITYELTRKKNT